MDSERLSDRGPGDVAACGSLAAVDPTTIDREADADTFLRLFEHSPDLLCVAGFDGHFKKLNPVWERTLGWTPGELCSRPWLDFVHPEDRAATIAAGETLLAGRPLYDFENRYLCRDGSWRWLSWHSFPLPAERRIYAVARDVTAQKATRRELERIQWLLRPGRVGDANVYEPPYGDAAALNTSGLILRSVGREMLRDIVRDFLELLGTSAAVYERNGDYALGIFASGYCRLLDERSFRRCGTGDIREAVACGGWRWGRSRARTPGRWSGCPRRNRRSTWCLSSERKPCCRLRLRMAGPRDGLGDPGGKSLISRPGARMRRLPKCSLHSVQILCSHADVILGRREAAVDGRGIPARAGPATSVMRCLGE